MSKASLFWDAVSLASHVSTGAGLGRGLVGQARLREIDKIDPAVRSYLEKKMGRSLTSDDAQFATDLAFKKPEDAAPLVASFKKNKQIGSAVGGTLGAGVFGARKYVAHRQEQAAKRKVRNMALGATGLGAAAIAGGAALNEKNKRGKDKLAAIFRSNSEAAVLGALGGAASDLTRHLTAPGPLTANKLMSVPLTAAVTGAATAGARGAAQVHADAIRSKRNRKLLVGALALGGLGAGGYKLKQLHDERKSTEQLKTAGLTSMLGHFFAPNLMHAAGAGLGVGAVGGIANVAREGANIARSFGPNALANAAAAEKAALSARKAHLQQVRANKGRIFEDRHVASHAYDTLKGRRDALAKAHAANTGTDPAAAAKRLADEKQLARFDETLGKLDKHRHATIQPGFNGKYMAPIQVPLMTGSPERGAAAMSSIQAANAAKASKTKAQFGALHAARTDKAMAQKAQAYANANNGQMPSLMKDPKGFMGMYGGQLAGAFGKGFAPAAAAGAAGKYGLDAMRAHKMRQAFKTWAPPVLIGGAAYGLLNRD